MNSMGDIKKTMLHNLEHGPQKESPAKKGVKNAKTLRHGLKNMPSSVKNSSGSKNNLKAFAQAYADQSN
jgi:hypothetical protein